MEVVLAFDGSSLEVTASVEEGDVAVDRGHRNLVSIWSKVGAHEIRGLQPIAGRSRQLLRKQIL